MFKAFSFFIAFVCSFFIFAQNTSVQHKIKAHYSFEKNIEDVSENNNVIFAPLPITYADGSLGKAITFKNEGERLEIPHTISSLDTAEKAISLWIYASEYTNDYSTIFDKTSASDYALNINKKTGKLQFTIHTLTKFTYFDCPIELKKWYFIVISKNANGVYFYVNAEQIGFTPIIQNLGKPNPLIVGAGGSPYQKGYGFNGKIDELTFYSTYLTEKEIKDLYIQKDVDEVKPNEKFQLGKVLFKRDESELMTVSYPSLNKILDYMNANPKSKLLITGHTDNKGSEKHNLELSLERAQNVRAYFIENGIKKNKVKAKGKGGKEPISNDSSEEGMAQNRRVEFLIY